MVRGCLSRAMAWGRFVSGWQTGSPKISELQPPKPEGQRKTHLNAGGADFSPDGAALYWSSGERGSIFVFDTASGSMIAEISLNVETGGTKFNDSYAVDVKLSGDGRYLYCADVTNFRLAVVDTGAAAGWWAPFLSEGIRTRWQLREIACWWPISGCSNTAPCRRRRTTVSPTIAG